jgi:hypothetical protein
MVPDVNKAVASKCRRFRGGKLGKNILTKNTRAKAAIILWKNAWL